MQLIGAILLEQNDERAIQRARYMTLETIAPLSDDPTARLPAIANCLPGERVGAPPIVHRLPPVTLSITHKFSSDHGAQRDVGEARQPAPHDRIAGGRIAGAGEITAEPGDLDEIVRERFLSRLRGGDQGETSYCLTQVCSRADFRFFLSSDAMPRIAQLSFPAWQPDGGARRHRQGWPSDRPGGWLRSR